MEIYFGYVLKALLLPPGGNFLAVLFGATVSRRSPRLGRMVAWGALVTLFLLCLPAVAGLLALTIERHGPLDPNTLTELGPATIVILAGGKDAERAEYGGDTISPLTLQRVRYGAFLARRSGLPVAVTGGTVLEDGASEAELMAAVLKDEFAVEVTVVESGSRNTAENAMNTAKRLQHERIVLVTHALHMRRAVSIFEAQGFEVIAAPLDAVGLREFPGELFDWLPSTGALSVSRYVLHEWLGIAWYAVRY